MYVVKCTLSNYTNSNQNDQTCPHLRNKINHRQPNPPPLHSLRAGSRDRCSVSGAGVLPCRWYSLNSGLSSLNLSQFVLLVLSLLSVSAAEEGGVASMPDLLLSCFLPDRSGRGSLLPAASAPFWIHTKVTKINSLTGKR